MEILIQGVLALQLLKHDVVFSVNNRNSMKYLFLCLSMSTLWAHAANDPLVKAYERFAKKMSGYEYVSNDLDPKASFLMSTSEITNLDYLEFLYAMKTTEGKEVYQSMLPDSSQWQAFPTFGATLEEVYHDHPGYHHFPAVNITHDQARAYCEWLEGVLRKNELTSGYTVEVKLPSLREWTYAATKGGNEKNQLPWDGLNLHKEGEPRAIYNEISQFDVLRSENGTDLKILESSYYYPYPKRYGTFMGDVHSLATGFWNLAHMAGNVAEFVEEKGYTKGGSWQDPAFYLLNHVTQEYEGDGASISNGFRVLVKLTPEDVN